MLKAPGNGEILMAAGWSLSRDKVVLVAQERGVCTREGHVPFAAVLGMSRPH